MNLEEYKQKRELYAKFAETIKQILHAAIPDSSLNYHLQQIQCRAKTIESLEMRLVEQGNRDADNIEEIRKDLAGCRVIFYYNDDVNTFLSSGLIRDNFKVHWEQSQPHHPMEKITSANDYYTANHYIIELYDNRADLPEYADYKGLRCEIQIHTVLTHAWAETAHDIIYKGPETPGFGSRILKSIDDRLQKIMKDYLIPVGYEFQKVQLDYKRLLEGKELFGRDVKKEILTSASNNDRHEILQSFRESTLPLYDSDYMKEEIATVIDIAKAAVLSAQGVKITDIETPFGSFPGKSLQDILEVSLSILNYVQYVSVEDTFSCMVELYLTVPAKDEKDSISKATGKLVQYNPDVLQQAGFYVQNIVLAHLEKCDNEILIAIKKLVVKVCSTILEPSVEGMSSNYKSITIKRSSLPANDATSNMRRRALALLKCIYSTEDEDNTKRLIISAFNSATRTPHIGNYEDGLLSLILRNSKEVVDFYTSIISSEKYELLESIEEDVCFLYRLSKDIHEAQKVEDTMCIERCEALIESAISFKNQLNSNQEFVIYKTLVGYESVFAESWDNSEWQVRGVGEYKEQKIPEYANSITDVNQEYWQKIILRCTETKSDDQATFLYFGKFLNRLAKQNPVFVFQILNHHEEQLSGFLRTILDGFLRGSAEAQALDLMNKWADDGKYLYDCAKVFEFYQPLDEPLLRKLFARAIVTDDTAALIKVMTATAKNYSDENHLLTDLFIPAIRALTNLGSAAWVFEFWYRKELSGVIAALNEWDSDTVLENLLLLEKIDSHAEEILAPIANRFPEKLLTFFQTRLSTEKEDGKPASDFDAIPYSFHRLHEPLSTNMDLVVDTISHWYDGEYSFFTYGGARLIHNIFPAFPDELESKLVAYVHSGHEENLLFVMAVVRNYEGNPVVNNVCKELVKALPEDSDQLSQVMIIFESKGVVWREFGHVEAYKQKKQEITAWLEDHDEKIKTFAKRCIASLDKQILSEKRRAEESIELQKHQFGNEEENDTESPS